MRPWTALSTSVDQLIQLVIPAANIVMLVAVGMDLSVADFRRLDRHRALVCTGLLAPVVVLPALAAAAASALGASPELRLAVLLVAACPIGGVANAYTYLAGASTALSVALTGLSCLLAWVTIPLIGKSLDLIVDSQFGLAAPTSLLIQQVGLVFGLPVVLGAWIRARAPGVAARSQGLMKQLTLAGVVAVLALVIAQDPAAFVASGSDAVPLAIVFILSSMAAGWSIGAMITGEPGDRFVFAAQFGCRNLAVATTIAVTILGRIEFASFAATYFLTEIPLLLLAAAAFRRIHAARNASLPSTTELG